MHKQFTNEHKHAIPDPVPGSPFSFIVRLSSLVLFLFLAACSDLVHPVNSTPEPTEYSFNYWLLQRIYLYEDELPNLPEDGDSVQVLYKTLKDPYTRYTPPSKSKATITQINTSMIEGDVGMAVIHAGLQSVTDICKFNSLFHKMFNFSAGKNLDIIPMRHR